MSSASAGDLLSDVEADLGGSAFTVGASTADRRAHLYAQLKAIDDEEDAQRKSVFVAKRSSLARRPQSAIEQARRFSRSDSLSTSFTPSFVAMGGKVLRFYAYFKETVSNSATESWRARKCAICYFLEDDSLRIDERKTKNSGLSQGPLLKRAVVYKGDGTPFQPEDFVVGNDVMIYGRCYHIVDADRATRSYALEELGFEIPEAEEYPESPHDVFVAERSLRVPPAVPITGERPPDKLAQFLQRDRQVLRFQALWDTRESQFDGEKREFTLHFFLSDDTVEVCESASSGSGRDAFPKLLARCKLPKGTEGAHIMPEDLLCGQYIRVFTRPLLLVSCDRFTTEWYKRELGVEQRKVLLPVEPGRHAGKSLKPPPYTIACFGGEEDSLMSCLSLQPKQPRKDYAKYVENDKKVIKFWAELAEPTADDVGREFIISFYLSDDTVSIYEPPQRNTGIVGGRFLERARYKLPVDGDRANARWVRPGDFRVGAEMRFMTIRGAPSHCFRLTRCDASTRALMSEKPELFPQNTVEQVASRLASRLLERRVPVRELFSQLDTDGSGAISRREFRELLDRWLADMDLHNALSPSDMQQLMDIYDTDGDGQIMYPEFCDAMITRAHGSAARGNTVQTVEKKLLEAMRVKTRQTGGGGISLRKLFRRSDPDASGFITFDEFSKLVKNQGFEVTASELAQLMIRYDTNGDGRIEYNEFCDKVYSSDYGVQDAYLGEATRSESAKSALSEEQRRLTTPTMHEYRERLRKAQFEEDEKQEVRRVMKLFCANFFSRKAALHRAFLAFDSHGTGKISARDFASALESTNNDFSATDKTLIVNTLYPSPDEKLDFAKLTAAMFKQDLAALSLATGNNTLPM